MSEGIGTSCIIEAKPGHDLDEIVFYIRRNHPELRDAVDDFKVFQGAAPLHGAGEGPSVKIFLDFANVTNPDTLKVISEVIKLAGASTSKMRVQIDPKRT